MSQEQAVTDRPRLHVIEVMQMGKWVHACERVMTKAEADKLVKRLKKVCKSGQARIKGDQ